jgi:hypothetical protein
MTLAAVGLGVAMTAAAWVAVEVLVKGRRDGKVEEWFNEGEKTGKNR